MAKKRTTLGKMSNSRMTWGINPVSRIKPKKSKHISRSKAKQELRSGKWGE